jgi:hypothetical protein
MYRFFCIHVLLCLIFVSTFQADLNVREKILSLIDTWHVAFGGPSGKYRQYHAAYEELRVPSTCVTELYLCPVLIYICVIMESEFSSYSFPFSSLFDFIFYPSLGLHTFFS